MNSTIDFINAKMNKQDAPVPQFLYKYRPFDDFALDMLEKRYVYLCPAEKLDDPSECTADFSVQDFYHLETGLIKFKCIEMILEQIKPYTTEENLQRVRNIVFRVATPSGMVRRNFLLDASCEIQDLVPEVDTAPLINFLGSIPEKFDDPKIKEQLEKLLALAYHARQGMGICSLSALKNSNEMWHNYADDTKGYCIEYDLRGYENVNLLFPVVYQDNRETNIVTNMVAAFIGQMIVGMSYGQIAADRSQFMRMFLTKDTKWASQKEWRLLGDANDKLPAPIVHAVYLGKNMTDQNKKQMLDCCQAHDRAVHIEE